MACTARALSSPAGRSGPAGLRNPDGRPCALHGQVELVPALQAHADSGDELLAEHARWALERLASGSEPEGSGGSGGPGA